MTVQRNPFPDYPVTRLQDKSLSSEGPTIVTAQIQQARSYVREYVSSWGDSNTKPDKPRAFIVSVRGDYGTGKTFLLLDAVAVLRQELRNRSEPTVLRFSCLETDPVTWYRTEVGPLLNAELIDDLMAQVYARAGERVADEAKLTEVAAQKLRKDPRFIYSLVSNNLLNRTAVDQTLIEILAVDCGIKDEDTCKAYASLVWEENAAVARRWLAGEVLNSSELDQLRVSGPITNESQVAAAMTALASLHTFLWRPLGIFIDELEHLVRYDASRNARRNVTWLKRVLEGFSRSAVMVFIAGHWEAWEAKPDYPDRFTQQRRIELWKLTAEDVDKIVRTWVEDSKSVQFDLNEAKVVVELTGGTLRRILSLLRALFTTTDGFRKVVSTEHISSLAETIGQKISLDDAKLHLHEILEKRGFHVEAPVAISGISFDLAGYRAGKPALFVDFKHAVLTENASGDAQLFFSKVLSAQALYPGAMGFLIADGNIDIQAVSVLNTSQVPILAFDLTQKDVLSRLTVEIDKHLTDEPQQEAGRAIQELSAQSQSLLGQIEAAQKARDSELTQQLESEQKRIQQQLAKAEENYARLARSIELQVGAIERQRQAEAREFQNRMDELVQTLRSEREKSVITGAAASSSQTTMESKVHVTYAELTRRPAAWVRLSYAISPVALVYFGAATICMIVVLMMPFLAELIYPRMSLMLRLLSYSGFILSIALGSLIVLRRFQLLDRYYDFCARMLREIYVRSEAVEPLVTADHILRSSLEESGPIEGRRRAASLLRETFPGMLDTSFQYSARDFPSYGTGP
jgi:hypothetical protein